MHIISNVAAITLFGSDSGQKCGYPATAYSGRISKIWIQYIPNSGFPHIVENSWKSLKVHEFFSLKLKALKVLENMTDAWKSLNFIPQVLESPWIHQVKLRDINNFAKQVFCLKQGLLIIVMFCFYQLKLSRNHRNRY